MFKATEIDSIFHHINSLLFFFIKTLIFLNNLVRLVSSIDDKRI